MKKVILITLTIIVLVISFASVYAETAGNKTEPIVTGNPITVSGTTIKTNTAVDNLSGYVWGSVVTIVRILALAAVAFVGISYMFAESGEKAKLKERLILVAIGALLVFAAPTVIALIISIFEGFKVTAT